MSAQKNARKNARNDAQPGKSGKRVSPSFPAGLPERLGSLGKLALLGAQLAQAQPCLQYQTAQLLAALKHPVAGALLQKVALVERNRFFQRRNSRCGIASLKRARPFERHLERFNIPPIVKGAVEAVATMGKENPFGLPQCPAQVVERIVEIATQLRGGGIGPELQANLLFGSGTCRKEIKEQFFHFGIGPI